MTYFYGRFWSRGFNDPWSEEEARRRWSDPKANQVAVVAGVENAQGGVPEYSIVAATPDAWIVTIYRYTADGSQSCVLNFQTVTERLFLQNVEWFEYPDRTKLPGPTNTLRQWTWTFAPGNDHITTQVRNADPAVTVFEAPVQMAGRRGRRRIFEDPVLPHLGLNVNFRVVDDYTDVDTTGHWMDPVEFGDWERVAAFDLFQTATFRDTQVRPAGARF